ncbi:MAG: isochorismatase family protein [Dehalococcoidia bacterium]
MAVWDDVITERDHQVYETIGRGGRMGFGEKPALVIIDVNYNWVGDRREPVLESIKRYPASCGEEAWDAVYSIASLLSLAREKGVPVIYSTGDRRLAGAGRRGGPSKFLRGGELVQTHRGDDIVDEIAPQEGDIVIYKAKPSIFFGTPLVSILNARRVDTLLVGGGTTSGCVRASVVDAFSYNFRVSVIEECTFDRGQTTHKINLFDMNAKYADVISAAQVGEYLSAL